MKRFASSHFKRRDIVIHQIWDLVTTSIEEKKCLVGLGSDLFWPHSITSHTAPFHFFMLEWSWRKISPALSVSLTLMHGFLLTDMVFLQACKEAWKMAASLTNSRPYKRLKALFLNSFPSIHCFHVQSLLKNWLWDPGHQIQSRFHKVNCDEKDKPRLLATFWPFCYLLAITSSSAPFRTGRKAL